MSMGWPEREGEKGRESSLITKDFYGDVIIDEEARDELESHYDCTVEVRGKSFLQFQKLLRPDVPG